MLLGIVGCIGAWFEKKALLFIVIKIFAYFSKYQIFIFLLVYHSNDYNLYWIINWRCISYCYE